MQYWGKQPEEQIHLWNFFTIKSFASSLTSANTDSLLQMFTTFCFATEVSDMMISKSSDLFFLAFLFCEFPLSPCRELCDQQTLQFFHSG